MLEKKSGSAFSRGEVDLAFRVEKRASVKDNPSLIRRLYPRDTAKNHTLAAPGRAKQSVNLIFCLEGDIETERREGLSDITYEGHSYLPAPAFLFSKRFTTIMITSERIRLIRTQNIASLSCPVCQR